MALFDPAFTSVLKVNSELRIEQFYPLNLDLIVLNETLKEPIKNSSNLWNNVDSFGRFSIRNSASDLAILYLKSV